MPEGRTPGRHDGRDAEVRRFSPLPLRRHPSSRARRHLLVRVQSLVTPIFLLRSISCFPPRLSRPHDGSSHRREVLYFPLFLKESPENHHPHLRQGILGLPFASPPFLSSSFSFCHQAFLRIDMTARGSERGASTSPLEAIASAVSVVTENFPPGGPRAVTIHPDYERYVVTAVDGRRRLLSLDFTKNVQHTTRLRWSTSRTPLARRSSSHAHRLPHHGTVRHGGFVQRGAAGTRRRALRAQYRPAP